MAEGSGKETCWVIDFVLNIGEVVMGTCSHLADVVSSLLFSLYFDLLVMLRSSVQRPSRFFLGISVGSSVFSDKHW